MSGSRAQGRFICAGQARAVWLILGRAGVPGRGRRGDLSELQQVASATGGTLFNVEQEPLCMLSTIVADLRGYQ